MDPKGGPTRSSGTIECVCKAHLSALNCLLFLFLTPRLPLPESRALLVLPPTDPHSGMDSRLKPQAPHFPSLPFRSKRFSPKPPTWHGALLCPQFKDRRVSGPHGDSGVRGKGGQVRGVGAHTGWGGWSEPGWGGSMSVRRTGDRK